MTLLLVGAKLDDDGNIDRGAVYIFEKDSSDVWSQTLKISENGGGTTGLLNIDLNGSYYFGIFCIIFRWHTCCRNFAMKKCLSLKKTQTMCGLKLLILTGGQRYSYLEDFGSSVSLSDI